MIHITDHGLIGTQGFKDDDNVIYFLCVVKDEPGRFSEFPFLFVHNNLL